MRVPRRIKIQLAIFTVIGVVSMMVLAIGYVHAPALLFKTGRYTVTLQLHQAGGLYDRANVTYRGTEIGRVTDVKLTNTGVEAVLLLKSGIAIPSDLDAQVHSQSAIGEQYVALQPRDARSRPLRDGDVIVADRTSVPTDINDVLNTTNTALAAIPRDNLKTLIDESYTALGGLGPELGRIVDGSTALARDSKTNLADLTSLVDNAAPLLDSQVETSDAVTAWAAHLASITGQLQQRDSQFAELLRNAGPATTQVQTLLDRLNPTLPVLLANLAGVADVALVFQPNIEQLLVLIPQSVQIVSGTTMAGLNTRQPYKGAFEQFAFNLNLPPPCSTGYLPASQTRSPVLTDYPDRPPGSIYCRIPQDSWNDVRGARNIPCETKPWKRAPTVAMCESNEDYVPLNSGMNWKGDPNATLSGQSVPQQSPGPGPSPDGRPPVSSPPAALAFADYNAADGTYVGSDGRVYTQANLGANGGPTTWQQMLTPPGG